MLQDTTATQKADQIAHRFFSKFALVVDNARAYPEPRESLSVKVDKWFNLETPDSEIYKDHLRAYRSISSLTSPPPPFELQVLLTIPELTNNQVLVFHDPAFPRVRIDPTPTHILLESWQLEFMQLPQRYGTASGGGEVTLATVYKHGMSLFRSLYALLRVLPTWRLCKRLRRRGASSRTGALGIEVRIGGGDTTGMRILGFNSPLSRTPPSPTLAPSATHKFAPITHPSGEITLTATYLTAPHFQLDTLESLLSSRFLSLDAGPEFTPTLARNRDSTSFSNSNSHSHAGSPGSLPMRTSLPRSPPKSTMSVAERFVLPASGPGSRGAPLHPFPRTSPHGRNVPLPPLGQASDLSYPRPPSVTGHLSGSNSSRLSQDGTNITSMASRMRRDSGGAGRGADLPSAPLPLPIRRPSINAVHPFKSSTLSSGSPSFQSPSRHLPLSNGPPRQGMTPSPSSISASRHQSPSPRGMGGGGARTLSSPVPPLRPSPPGQFTPLGQLTPSSLGDRRTPASLAAAAAADSRPKRYSSSFGHRYAASGGAASEGSTGSGERERRDSDREQPISASFLSTNTDDDDISMFVQAIDARKPLAGGTSHDSALGLHIVHERAHTENVKPFSGDRTEGYRHERAASDSPFADSPTTGTAAEPPAAMAMSQVAVDERLRQLNEAFRTSLDGITGRRSGPRSAVERGTERERAKTLASVLPTAPGMGRAVSEAMGTPGPRTSKSGSGRASSGIEIARRAATIAAGGGSRSGSGSGLGSVSGFGAGVGYGRHRTVSATGSAASEEVLGKLEF